MIEKQIKNKHLKLANNIFLKEFLSYQFKNEPPELWLIYLDEEILSEIINILNKKIEELYLEINGYINNRLLYDFIEAGCFSFFYRSFSSLTCYNCKKYNQKNEKCIIYNYDNYNICALYEINDEYYNMFIERSNKLIPFIAEKHPINRKRLTEAVMNILNDFLIKCGEIKETSQEEKFT